MVGGFPLYKFVLVWFIFTKNSRRLVVKTLGLEPKDHKFVSSEREQEELSMVMHAQKWCCDTTVLRW